LEVVIQLDPNDKQLELFGAGDNYLRLLRQRFGIQITAREGHLTLSGRQKDIEQAVEVFKKMQKQLEKRHHLAEEDVTSFTEHREMEVPAHNPLAISVFTHHKVVAPSTKGQQKYVKTMLDNDLTFCIGPAGTGKTYLAVAVAVAMLKKKEIRRIVLARPAVEAGEKLGFLPGDLQAKVNPYLRPLFDALEDMMDFGMMKKFMTLDIIEIIPLAFMRGRTLNDAVIICDEAQNTSYLQMLMVLTRLGHGSKMIITGDITQIDLEPGQKSGLIEAIKTLRGIKGIGYVELARTDIVRHKLVQKIVQAYNKKQSN
jgi:phosphate starvation-inducible protein PhoH and related proteins